MAVGGRDANHGVAPLHQRHLRGEGCGREPVEQHHVVARDGAAEMLQRERAEPLAVQGGRELVIGQRELLARERQGALEPGEVENALRSAPRDHRLRALELAKIVFGRADDLSAGVRQAGGEHIPEAITIRCHR
jgi:hypothetical protein